MTWAGWSGRPKPVRGGAPMDTGQKLPARMYRLAYDLDKDKPSGRAWLDYLVQARP